MIDLTPSREAGGGTANNTTDIDQQGMQGIQQILEDSLMLVSWHRKYLDIPVCILDQSIGLVRQPEVVALSPCALFGQQRDDGGVECLLPAFLPGSCRGRSYGGNLAGQWLL